PALLRERMSGPIQKEQKGWDKVLISIFFALWMSQYVLIGLDAVRFHWSGCAALAAGRRRPWHRLRLLCLPRGPDDEHIRGARGENPERAQAPGDLDRAQRLRAP